MRKERGFTLIELLIVLAILGILVGIVAMSVGGLTDTAKERGMRSELDIVQTAIDTFNTQDVLVGAGTTITAVTSTASVSAINDDDADAFGKYLRRDTKYYFAYDTGGEDLVVCDTAGIVVTFTTPGDPDYTAGDALCFPFE